MHASSQRIIEDYRASLLSVRQIAAKHGVCIRTVYNAVSGINDRRGYAKPMRVQIRLTEQEADALLSCIAQAGTKDLTLQAISERIRNSIEERRITP